MKANELRIGNFVYSKQFDEQRIVGLIGNGNLLSYEQDNGGLDGTRGIVDAEPIPLTEEWLVRFGFEFSKLGGFWFFDKLYDFNIKSHLDNSYHLYIDNIGINVMEIKHIHQLQNLYFALTGEELTLKDA